MWVAPSPSARAAGTPRTHAMARHAREAQTSRPITHQACSCRTTAVSPAACSPVTSTTATTPAGPTVPVRITSSDRCGGVGRGQPVGGVGEAVPVEGAGAERERQHHDVRRRERREVDPVAHEHHERRGGGEGEHGHRREDHRQPRDRPVDPGRRRDATAVSVPVASSHGRGRSRGQDLREQRHVTHHRDPASAAAAAQRPRRSPRRGASRGRGAARGRGTSARGSGRARWSGGRRATRRPAPGAMGLGHDRAGDRHEAVEQDRHPAGGGLDQEPDGGGEVGAAQGGEAARSDRRCGPRPARVPARRRPACGSSPSSSMPVPRPVTSSAGRPRVAATSAAATVVLPMPRSPVISSWAPSSMSSPASCGTDGDRPLGLLAGQRVGRGGWRRSRGGPCGR